MYNHIKKSIGGAQVSKNKNNIFKRFILSKKVSVLLVLFCFICFIFYILTVALSRMYEQELIRLSPGMCTFIDVSKDVLLMTTSILSVNLITSVVIEVKNKNKLLSEFFSNDIVSSPDFYSKLDFKDKMNMLKGLQMTEYFDGNDVYYSIHDSVIKHLKKENEEYYFDKCEYIVNAKDKGEYFEKTVTRSIQIKSYEKKKSIKKFMLARISLKQIDDMDNFQIKELRINGKTRPLSEIISEDEFIGDDLSKRNGYDKRTSFSLKSTLILSNDKATEITVKMVNVCPKDDLVSSYKATVPCKNFSVEYVMNDTDKYRIIAYGFGFINDAKQHPSNHGDNGVKLELSDWVLRDNGIVITIVPKIEKY